jgi:hypothetical protein
MFNGNERLPQPLATQAFCIEEASSTSTRRYLYTIDNCVIKKRGHLITANARHISTNPTMRISKTIDCTASRLLINIE